MAGHRHHILPRFLLKGFASKQVGEEIFVWTFRKNAKPFEPNIKNISVENHFYGKSGEINADDSITAFETDYISLINELRESKNIISPCDPKIAEYIAHISLRTKSVRESFINIIDFFTTKFQEHLAKPINLQKIVKVVRVNAEKSYAEKYPHLTRNEIRKVFNENATTQAIQSRLQNNQDEIIKSILEKSPEMIERLRTVPQEFKEKHNELLIDSSSLKPKLETYQKLNWFVYQTDEPLILGDSGCLIETGGKYRFKTYDLTDDYILNIFLPIATNKLVVGTRYRQIPPLKIKEINTASAKCSGEYFISSQNNPNCEKLALQIGEWFGIMRERELDEFIQHMVWGMFNI